MILAMALSSCQKDLGKPAQADISPDDLAMAKKIISFVDRMYHVSAMSSANLKSSGVMELDSALWNIEAAVNYLYADIPEQFEFIAIDSSATSITLQINSGMCSEADVANIFGQLQNELESYLNVNNDVQLVAAGLKSTPDPTGNVQLTLQYLVAAPAVPEPVQVIPTLVPFTNGWKPAMSYQCNGGMCESDEPGHAHTDKCKDLATEIQRKINTYCLQLHHTDYWTDIEFVYIYNGSYFGNPDDDECDNYRDCLIYHTSWKCCSHCFGNMYWLPCTFGACLPKEECNFYLQSTFDVLSRPNAPNAPGACPVGKEVIQITNAFGDIYPAMENAHIDHFFDIKYGISHKRPPEPYNPDPER